MKEINCYCSNCGKGFHAKKSSLERKQQYYYCCKQCQLEHRNKTTLEVCICCGKTFERGIKSNRKVCKASFCDEWYKKWFREPNTKCIVCGREFWCRPSSLLPQGNCCCYECSYINRSDKYTADGNPQYGLKGSQNSSYKGEKTVQHGYVYIYVGFDHPFADKSGRIREHRYIAEQFLMEEKHKVYINGKAYLSPEYHVHHINENKTDNRPENLQILTKSEHTSLHTYLDPQPHSIIDGKFISKN